MAEPLVIPNALPGESAFDEYPLQLEHRKPRSESLKVGFKVQIKPIARSHARNGCIFFRPDHEE
jgi:hypothetical protein